MVASLTSLPVVGVPIKTSTLNGNDSLLSIVQMPKGIPVATVAIGNAANAGKLMIYITIHGIYIIYLCLPVEYIITVWIAKKIIRDT
jgi:phosphoribosylaminoimidazole carboxylase PurE protein